MTTYVYETIPTKPDEKPRHFEFRQSMKDPPLSKHPETGEPIRRVMSGGLGILSSGKSDSASTPSRGASSCGAGCGCH